MLLNDVWGENSYHTLNFAFFVICNSGTLVARILYYTSYGRFYISLSNDVGIRKYRQKILKREIKNRFYHFYFLNRNIPVTM